MIKPNNFERTKSVVPIKTPKKAELTKTIQVASHTSRRVDQETFFNSDKTSIIKFLTFAIMDY